MIEIKHLTFGYKKDKVLFDDLSLTLPLGNIYGLLGKNGAGKTTLLKQIAGLLYPYQGECLVMGQPSRYRQPEILQDIFIIPEEFTMPSETISAYTKLYAPFYPKFDKEVFSNYLNEFGLSADRKLTTLSYGQKKKFLVGFGLATRARILLMDEPTNGLDIPSKSQFRRIIASSVNEDRCFIISTHQVRDLESLIDPIIILDQGKIVFHHTMEEISRKLGFVQLEKEDQPSGLIYSEMTFSGKNAIVLNSDHEETRVDLELLFNGIISRAESFTNIFN
ncbi:MAG: ABC transporter ATP-binding protein [Bacteroidota bacterium]|nr:ABC transporter ATP-binding protein [Bacteroidota bacterium]